MSSVIRGEDNFDSDIIPAGRVANAWVNFDGTGTPSVRDSYNISSVIDNLVGDYTINFETLFDNTNYIVLTGNVLDLNASTNRVFGILGATDITGKDSVTTSNIRMILQSSNGSRTDQDVLCVSMFGGMN